MAVDEQFQARITVRDETAAALRAIGQRFAALARQTGLARLGQAAAGVGRAFGGLALQVANVGGPVAALGGAAVGAGLVSLAVKAAAAGDDLSDLSAATGASMRELQAYGQMAERAGASQETLASSLQRLSRGMVDAATGGNQELAGLFRHLGISLRDANGQIRSAADILPQVAEAFRRTENPAVQARLATELFGRAGAALIPMLAQGAQALEEGTERWAKYGFDLFAVGDAMSTADGQFKDLDASVRGLGLAIGAQLAPILGPIAERMADWVAANRDLIATRIGEWVQQVSDSLSRFFADTGPLDRLAEFGAGIVSVVDALGGIQNVLLGFGALAAAPFVAALVSIGAAVLPVLTAIGSLALALGAASPVGLAVIAFAGLAVAIRQNWGGLGDFFSDLWGGITSAFQRAYSVIRPIADAVGRLVSSITGGREQAGPPNPVSRLSPDLPRSSVGSVLPMSPMAAALARARTPLGSVLPASPLAVAPAGAAQQGQVEVTVNLNNAPPGTRVEAEATGGLVATPQTNVGFALGRNPR